MKKDQIEIIRKALSVANGKRRERLATLDDVASVIARVARSVRDPLAPRGRRRICGTVANSYKYRASATVIVAALVGETVRLRLYDGYAAKVAGGGSGYQEGTKSADVLALLGETPPAGTIEIPRTSATRWPNDLR